jgi:hypothetical protein
MRASAAEVLADSDTEGTGPRAGRYRRLAAPRRRPPSAAPGGRRAHHLGAGPVAAQADTELRATGARRRVLPTGLEALTASERRVAELAANGLTNRQIAQTLFITSPTVEATSPACSRNSTSRRAPGSRPAAAEGCAWPPANSSTLVLGVPRQPCGPLIPVPARTEQRMACLRSGQAQAYRLAPTMARVTDMHRLRLDSG